MMARPYDPWTARRVLDGMATPWGRLPVPSPAASSCVVRQAHHEGGSWNPFHDQRSTLDTPHGEPVEPRAIEPRTVSPNFPCGPP